jgi:hypothetical protein
MLRGPVQSLEFLAVPLVQGPVTLGFESVHAVLGTPLYVAAAQLQDTART